MGVLEPVEHAEYASPIVLVMKNNGTIKLGYEQISRSV